MDVSRRAAVRRGFTLTELLVAMGVIAILATLTIVSVRGITKDARLASATNAVVAALGEARAIAMRDNAIVAVVFRARWDETQPRESQFTEVVIAKWTGESPPISVTVTGGPETYVVDRFVPVPGVSPRPLPTGIKVAGPRYHSTGLGEDHDELWTTQSHLPAVVSVNEEPLRMIAIMYAPDGTVISRNSATDSDRFYVDFDNDRMQQVAGTTIDYAILTGTAGTQEFFVDYMLQWSDADEPYGNIVPFLAVFDDEELRSLYDVNTWSTFNVLQANLTEYITNHANRIYFNQYTGVVMKASS